MRLKLRFALIVLIVPTAAAAIWAAPAGWVRETGLDFWRYGDAQDDYRDAQATAVTQRLQLEQTRERFRLMDSIAFDVASGRLSLVEATALFADLNRQPTDITDGIRRRFPAATDRESVARQVMSWSRERAASNPSRADELDRRLNSELAAIIAEEAKRGE
jgi:hypothetical protein